MSSAHELAAHLAAEVRRLRLKRVGVQVDDLHQSFYDLPPHEQQPWLDSAEVVLAMLGARVDDIMRLRGLCDDWERYTTVLARDRQWRDDMRRAIVVEMRVTIDRLWKEAGGG